MTALRFAGLVMIAGSLIVGVGSLLHQPVVLAAGAVIMLFGIVLLPNIDR